MMAYNSTPQESSEFGPHCLVYGEEMVLNIDLLYESIVENSQEESCS